MLLPDDITFADRLFRRPLRTYAYDDIITGTEVRGRNRRLRAVDRNTFRGFHRISDECPGASNVFRRFMLEHKTEILQALRDIGSRLDLNKFSQEMTERIRSALTNTKQEQLSSYNKVRKPFDLYLEHLVAMATEFSSEDRDRLVPLLFLPLDSWVMGSDAVFTVSDLSCLRLSRKSTYSSVRDKGVYDALQKIAHDRATIGGHRFPPIYFDLVWRDRYLRREAGNLFESNPPES